MLPPHLDQHFQLLQTVKDLPLQELMSGFLVKSLDMSDLAQTSRIVLTLILSSSDIGMTPRVRPSRLNSVIPVKLHGSVLVPRSAYDVGTAA